MKNINELRNQTVIRATYREEDLYPAFLTLLRLLDPGEAEKYEEDFYNIPKWAGAEELDRLFDALDDRAPSGCYFGSGPGDASDFGFWGFTED